MKERLDYQAWYFVPSVNHNYIRKENEISQEFMDAKAGRARGIL